MNDSARFKAGHRRYKWHDRSRNRPVWADIWYPTDDARHEHRMFAGLGDGFAVADAPLAQASVRFPLMVMSHGANGSAPNYSWLAEYLARHGVAVLGVSHYQESWLYGADTVDPGAVTRLWVRPLDCSFALDQLLNLEEFRSSIDQTRIGAMGHSSGGATAITLAGAVFDLDALAAYCRSDLAAADCGCSYRQVAALLVPDAARRACGDPRIGAAVLLDPAAGPGFSAATLAAVRASVLVVGSTDNDFLPFEQHAGRYAKYLARATLVKLEGGEGHFVYVNTCNSDLAIDGVPLCVDRPGVDRDAVHARLAPQILMFLRHAFDA
jgi:predicted dienelactone hydrolase